MLVQRPSIREYPTSGKCWTFGGEEVAVRDRFRASGEGIWSTGVLVVERVALHSAAKITAI